MTFPRGLGSASAVGTALLSAFLLGGVAGGGIARAQKLQVKRPELVLPPGHERLAKGLLGPAVQSGHLPGGWTLRSITIQRDTIRYRFARAGRLLTLVLSPPHDQAAHRSKNFSVALTAAPGALPEAERLALLATVVRRVRRNDTGPPPWKVTTPQPRSSSVVDVDSRLSPPWYDLRHPVRLLQALLLLILLGLATRARWLARQLRYLGWRDGLVLTGLSLFGCGLRLVTGSRIPGWLNNHGYDLLNELLVLPSPGGDPHGNTANALHGLVQTVLPAREWVILATQNAVSVAIIPLVYLVGRAWLKDRRWALWAAVVAAVLPVSVYFANTEVRTVSGAFFLVAALAALGWSIRDPHPAPRFVAAFLAVLATQAYPILMVVPLVLLLFVCTAPGGRQLLRQRWTWAAAVVGLALYSTGAVVILSQLRGGSGVHGPSYLRTLTLFHSLFLPTFTAAARFFNVMLNHHYTPPLFWMCGVVAVVAAVQKRIPRGPVLALAASAMVLTLVGLVGDRMNSARIQLPAAPLYCLLAGVGLGLVQARIGWWIDRKDGLALIRHRRAAVALGVVAAAVGLSLLIWPGPLTMRGTPQRQHQLIIEGLARVDRRCIIVSSTDRGSKIGRVPTYLRGRHGHRFRWIPAKHIHFKARLAKGDCLVYFRPADCYDKSHSSGVQVDQHGRVGACSDVEARLTLRPLFTKTLPAIPDGEQTYTRRRFLVGFFTIEAAVAPGRLAPKDRSL